MALSWGSGRPAYWLGFPTLLPVQCGAPAAWLLSLFFQNWQVQACGCWLHLPRGLPPWTTVAVVVVVPTLAFFFFFFLTEILMSPFSLRVSIALQSFPTETGMVASFCTDALGFLLGQRSHAAKAPSQLVPHTYRPGIELTEDLERSF